MRAVVVAPAVAAVDEDEHEELRQQLQAAADRADKQVAAADVERREAASRLAAEKTKHDAALLAISAQKQVVVAKTAAAKQADAVEAETGLSVLKSQERVLELQQLLAQTEDALCDAKRIHASRADARLRADSEKAAGATLLDKLRSDANTLMANVEQRRAELDLASVHAEAARAAATLAAAKVKEAEDESVVARTFAGGVETGFEPVARRRLTLTQRARVRQRTDGYCYLCKQLLPDKGWHVEHVFAFSAEPAANDVIGNMLPSCATCNRRKGTRSLVDCMTLDGFSLMTEVAHDDSLSVQPRVKRVLLHALAVKHGRKASVEELATGLEAKLECSAAPEVQWDDVARSIKVGKGGQGVVHKATWKSSAGVSAAENEAIFGADAGAVAAGGCLLTAPLPNTNGVETSPNWVVVASGTAADARSKLNGHGDAAAATGAVLTEAVTAASLLVLGESAACAGGAAANVGANAIGAAGANWPNALRAIGATIADSGGGGGGSGGDEDDDNGDAVGGNGVAVADVLFGVPFGTGVGAAIGADESVRQTATNDSLFAHFRRASRAVASLERSMPSVSDKKASSSSTSCSSNRSTRWRLISASTHSR